MQAMLDLVMHKQHDRFPVCCCTATRQSCPSSMARGNQVGCGLRWLSRLPGMSSQPIQAQLQAAF